VVDGYAAVGIGDEGGGPCVEHGGGVAVVDGGGEFERLSGRELREGYGVEFSCEEVGCGGGEIEGGSHGDER